MIDSVVGGFVWMQPPEASTASGSHGQAKLLQAVIGLVDELRTKLDGFISAIAGPWLGWQHCKRNAFAAAGCLTHCCRRS